MINIELTVYEQANKILSDYSTMAVTPNYITSSRRGKYSSYSLYRYEYKVSGITYSNNYETISGLKSGEQIVIAYSNADPSLSGRLENLKSDAGSKSLIIISLVWAFFMLFLYKVFYNDDKFLRIKK